MAVGGKVTAREAQRLATRERVFAAAVAECGRAGVAEADIGAVVAAAGVAHGTFFFHFPTKEHVLAELGHREETRMARELDEFLRPGRDLGATLRKVVHLAAELEERLGTVLFDDMIALYFSPRRPELRLWPDHPLIARVVTAFEHAREQGETRDDPEVDPGTPAVFFFMGFFALLATHERSPERDALLDQSVAVVLRGLEPR